MSKETEYYENLTKAIKQLPYMYNQIFNAIENIFKELSEIIDRLENNIRTMDSDKFEKCLNEVDDIRLKVKVIAIRNGEKVSWF